MTERHEGGPVDGEINIRAIRIFVAGLLAVTLAVFGLMWGVVTLVKGSLVRKDPPLPELAEARVVRLPPGPILQPNPVVELADFRAAEDAELSRWAWVDREKGVARVPVDRAVEIVLERGLPAPPPMPPPEPTQVAEPAAVVSK